MTRDPQPTPRDHRIDAIARDLLALHRTLDRHLADVDDRLAALEASQLTTTNNKEAHRGR